jgi:hypothetical protein
MFGLEPELNNVRPLLPVITPDELERNMKNGLVRPEQMAYVVHTVTTSWWNHGVLHVLLAVAERKYELTVSVTTTRRWLSKDHHLKIYGPAWKIRVYIEHLARY